MMLAAVTGYADALRRLSAWYLTILEDLQPKEGQAKMEEMEKFRVRMEKFPIRMEKLWYIPDRIGAATSRQYLVVFRQDTRNVHYYVACSGLECDFGAERTPE